jgi:tRNA A-37 threonylcarbamoyl transferase component Bud32
MQNPTSSTEPIKCPSCGSTAGAAGGLCPACLLKEGIGSHIDSQMATATDGAKRVRGEAPSLDEIQACFPNFEIVDVLGQGGMGVVYKARQPQLDRFVAIKILPDEAGADPAFAERFSREAKTLAKLNHPNIVAVYDFGQVGGHFFLTMEFVDGMTLRQLESSKKLSPQEALAITPKICDALQYAHEEGVVHRDIKPGNILIDRKGRLKIADFGLAKLLGQESRDLSLTGDQAVMGTPHYMAPEQMTSSKTVDHRADIYSLGVVIYEMLTGELPVGRFAAPSKKVEIDVRLDEVVLKALENDPEMRYQRIDDVKSEIDSISCQISKLPPGIRRMLGFDYKSKRRMFGMPLLHVTTRMDPITGKPAEARGVFAFGGKAKGIFAFGGRSRGVFACGGIAQGVFAFGGISFGLVTYGGIAVALLLSHGGISVAPVAIGGIAMGLLAYGAPLTRCWRPQVRTPMRFQSGSSNTISTLICLSSP